MKESVIKSLSLKGRTALVTGAGGHLGKSICTKLSELGAKLILVDRDDEILTGTIKALKEINCDGWDKIIIDLENERQRENLIEQVMKKFSKLNILVNNAAFVGTSGLQGWSVPFENQTQDAWRRAIEVNLTAPFHLAQKLSPLMASSESASIVNIGSIYGFLGPDWRLYDGTEMANPAAYAASKGGLIQLTRWLACTLAPNIRVNCVSPGGIFRNQAASFVEKYCSKTLLKRMGSEDDIANAVIFIGSDMSRYVTGFNLVVDGGFSSW